MEVVGGDGCHGTAHAGSWGLAGIAHKVGDAEEAPQGLGVLWHLKVPAGGGGKCPKGLRTPGRSHPGPTHCHNPALSQNHTAPQGHLASGSAQLPSTASWL